MTTTSTSIKLGDKVRTKLMVEVFPHFILEAGATGVVCEVGSSGGGGGGSSLVWVKMDKYVPGCEEWVNEVAFGEDAEDVGTPSVADCLEVIGG